MDIHVKGYIVNDDEKWIYDWLGINCTCPKKITEDINKAKSIGENIVVKINSPGGSVYAASEIYTELKENGCTIKIVGLCASAASFIAMAGTSEMSPTAEMMIHRAGCRVEGNRNDMLHAAESLDDIDAAIANAYRLKTGRSEEEILNMMNHETYLNAQKCKDMGFVDSIMFDDGKVFNFADRKILMQVTNTFEGGLPSELIAAIKEKANKEKPNTETENYEDESKRDFFIAKAKLNLLNLGGK
ncbi:MAG: Clp protease ClpP [Candidatus Izemoplasmatales bacterium]|nr:Clp protease ClpP [Candidatus Izemoplasmatales bacterium]